MVLITWRIPWMEIPHLRSQDLLKISFFHLRIFRLFFKSYNSSNVLLEFNPIDKWITFSLSYPFCCWGFCPFRTLAVCVSLKFNPFLVRFFAQQWNHPTEKNTQTHKRRTGPPMQLGTCHQEKKGPQRTYILPCSTKFNQAKLVQIMM